MFSTHKVPASNQSHFEQIICIQKFPWLRRDWRYKLGTKTRLLKRAICICKLWYCTQSLSLFVICLTSCNMRSNRQINQSNTGSGVYFMWKNLISRWGRCQYFLPLMSWLVRQQSREVKKTVKYFHKDISLSEILLLWCVPEHSTTAIKGWCTTGVQCTLARLVII